MKKAVCALMINKEGQILAVSRKDNPNDFGFPGGKVDEGETEEEAIKREVKEETGLELVFAYPIFTDIDDNGEYECTTFCCIASGKIETTEKGIVDWVKWEILFKGSFKKYNKKAYKAWNKFVKTIFLKTKNR